MSASPDRKAASPAASPEPEVTEQVATPVAGDGNEGENLAEPTAEDKDVTENVDDELHGEDDEVDDDKISDDESILSEVDEAQFDNFDPENVDVEDRPQLAIDEDNLKLIGRHKRKRTEDGESRPRRKEGRREKKSRRADEGGDEEGSRRRDRKKREDKPDTDEEALDPETRMFCSYWQLAFHLTTFVLIGIQSSGRRRALDRAMDEAMKKPAKRRFRKQDGIVCVASGDTHSPMITDCTIRIWNLWQMLKSRICASA